MVSVVLLGVIGLPIAARAGDKVAVLDTVQAAVKLKLKIRGAVMAALDELAVAMVPLEDLTDDDAKCAEPECTVEIAKRTSATRVLIVDGVANPAGYRFSFELRDGETGRSLGTGAKDCELCAEDQIAPMVRDRIKKLWARVEKELAAADAPPPPPVVAPPRAQRPGLDTTTPKPWWKQATPLTGLGLGLVGVVATSFGIYYVAQDGKAIERSKITNDPIWVRDTGRWGWTFVGLGAIALVGGTAMLIWGQEDGTSVSMAVGPGSLGLHGKF